MANYCYVKAFRNNYELMNKLDKIITDYGFDTMALRNVIYTKYDKPFVSVIKKGLFKKM